MRYEVTVTCPLPPASARNGLLAWFQAIGYRATSPPFLSSVTVERGSIVGNFTSVNNVRLWRARVEVTYRAEETGSRADLAWDITTFGQTCTRSDIAFWETEIAMTVAVAQGGVGDLKAYRDAAARSASGGMGRASLLAVAILGPLIAGAFLGSLEIGVAGCVLIGTGTYWALRAPRRLAPDVPISVIPSQDPPIILETNGPPPIGPG